MMINSGLHGGRAGFALPMSILVIGFISAAVMAAFARSGAEIRIVDNQQAQQQAFALASAGLEEFFSMPRLNPADTTLGRTYTYGAGNAVVRARVLRRRVVATDTAMFVVHALGTSRAGVGRPAGSRIVAQLAHYVGGTMQVLSSWTSLSGIDKQGSSGIISGFDQCTATVLPGVAVPDGGYTQSGSGEPIKGEPPKDYMGTQEEMAAQIDIDWHGITNPAGPAITPDIVICKPGTYGYIDGWGPCGSWPTSAQFADPNFWPTIVVNGSLSPSLPADGKGTLIVTGDLSLGGGDKWSGIIMVGGIITDNGSGLITGAVVTGLNVLKGHTVGQSSKANGTKDYLYDSCAVEQAALRQGKLAQIANAWSDNWSAW
jgi:hypothetical protein